MILSFKKSLLVICKVLWLFVNTFTADDKYSKLNRDNFTQQIQMEFSQKAKAFSQLFSGVFKSWLKFEHFQKKVYPHTNVFRRLRTRKEALGYVSKKCSFAVYFDKQHSKGYQTHFKLLRWHVYHTDWSPIRTLILKKSVLVICKMLWRFINTFSADDNYSLLNSDDFMHGIQVQLLQKEKMFCQLFSAV